MAEQKPLREIIRDKMTEAFGPPEVIPSSSGDYYRWILQRPHSLSIYITLDSPEMPYLGHLMISDPSKQVVQPIQSITLRIVEDIAPIIEAIRAQWKS